MTSDNTTNGAVLGAATTGGFLSSLLGDWRYALLATLAILLTGLLIAYLRRKKKVEDQ